MIQIYTSNWCSYCNAAKNLLLKLNLAFEEINIGAASINSEEALNSILKLDLQYSMTPFFNKDLQQKAKEAEEDS